MQLQLHAPIYLQKKCKNEKLGVWQVKSGSPKLSDAGYWNLSSFLSLGHL